MVICFLGFRVLHWYERFAWIPALVAIIVATGCGGKHLSNQVDVPPADAPTVLSYAGLVAGFLIPWAAVASDYVTYMEPETPKWKVFSYTYAGVFLPTVFLMVLGAAIGGAVMNVPSWEAGYNSTAAGGVLAAMLEPAGGFGKFLVVLIALAILGNLTATMYSITLNFQLLIPWLVHIPRFVFAIVITAIVIPISIPAADNFFVSLENFIGIIGYWAAAYFAVVMLEHRVIRKSDYSTYDHAIWDVRRELPSGVAAMGAAICSFALVIPSMAQVWYTGPIAQHTGDIGFEMAFVVTALLYLPFRYAEIRIKGRL
jgi:purine-cytosine permease-like protein